MNPSDDEYRLLDNAGKTIAMGTKSQMFSFVKYHVPDGRYRIAGKDIKLHCLRKDGIVEPDPDGVCLKAKGGDALDGLDIIFTDPPYGDEPQDDADE